MDKCFLCIFVSDRAHAARQGAEKARRGLIGGEHPQRPSLGLRVTRGPVWAFKAIRYRNPSPGYLPT